MWRDSEQPGDGDTPRPQKLKDVLGSRPCSDSHQTAQAHPSAAEILCTRAEARAAWCVPISRSPRRIPNPRRRRDSQGDRQCRRSSRHRLNFRGPVYALESQNRARPSHRRSAHLRETGATAVAHGIDLTRTARRLGTASPRCGKGARPPRSHRNRLHWRDNLGNGGSDHE